MPAIRALAALLGVVLVAGSITQDGQVKQGVSELDTTVDVLEYNAQKEAQVAGAALKWLTMDQDEDLGEGNPEVVAATEFDERFEVTAQSVVEAKKSMEEAEDVVGAIHDPDIKAEKVKALNAWRKLYIEYCDSFMAHEQNELSKPNVTASDTNVVSKSCQKDKAKVQAAYDEYVDANSAPEKEPGN